MKLHNWNLSTREARNLQLQLRSMLCFSSKHLCHEIIAGADVAYLKKQNQCIAACVLYSISEHKILETASSIEETTFPYIPGLLSFREAPVLLNTFKKLHKDFHIALLDGHGIAHPRRFGLASHIALWLKKPTIGCAKTKLIGEYIQPPHQPGKWTELLHRGEVIGAVLRTRKNVKPIFVSIGNGLNLHQAIEITFMCITKYRIPEPIRAAHNLVNNLKRKLQ
jgi:deoxyribonuclease V